MATDDVHAPPDPHRKDSSEGDTEASHPSVLSGQQAPPEYVAEDRTQATPLSATLASSEPAERLGGPTAWGAQGDGGGVSPPSYEESMKHRVHTVPVYAHAHIRRQQQQPQPPLFVVSAQPPVDTRALEVRRQRQRLLCVCVCCSLMLLLIPTAIFLLIYFLVIDKWLKDAF